MELRLDRLLNDLRSRPEDILGAIDRDPLLRKREMGDLVLANASKLLYTPQEVHQLFAKGIVFRRDPYRVVSLPLVKIYNLGEKAVTVGDLEALAHAGEGASPRLHFLKKYDGTMIQRFQHDGRVWYSTRGMLEGMSVFDGADDDEETPNLLGHFDYLGTARTLAERAYPALNETTSHFEGLTLIFELIHPEARIITNYGGREDLILISVFDHRRWGYFTYSELLRFGLRHGLTVVDAFSPAGGTLVEQLDHLLAMLVGTDQEGTVLTIEHGQELVYRVKSKSPDYLRLLRLLVRCNYDATVEILDAFPALPSWAEFEAFLRGQGSDKVPEEVLALYREHYERFVAYLQDCERLLSWALAKCAEVKAALAGVEDPRALRKAFAEQVKKLPHASVLFKALDGKLDLSQVRHYAQTPEEASKALARI